MDRIDEAKLADRAVIRSFGHNIKVLAELTERDLRQVSKEAHIPMSKLMAYMEGVGPISIDHLQSLGNLFRVPFKKLVFDFGRAERRKEMFQKMLDEASGIFE